MKVTHRVQPERHSLSRVQPQGGRNRRPRTKTESRRAQERECSERNGNPFHSQETKAPLCSLPGSYPEACGRGNAWFELASWNSPAYILDVPVVLLAFSSTRESRGWRPPHDARPMCVSCCGQRGFVRSRTGKVTQQHSFSSTTRDRT